MVRGKKQNHRRVADVTPTRAGLIPDSDFTSEEIRARMHSASCIVSALAAKARQARSNSEARAITEILSDLRHYCHFKGLPYDELDNAASDIYLAEGNLAI